METHQFVLPSGKTVWYGTINECALSRLRYLQSEISREDLLEEMFNLLKPRVLSPYCLCNYNQE